jgi:hypothetical protein
MEHHHNIHSLRALAALVDNPCSFTSRRRPERSLLAWRLMR